MSETAPVFRGHTLRAVIAGLLLTVPAALASPAPAGLGDGLLHPMRKVDRSAESPVLLAQASPNRGLRREAGRPPPPPPGFRYAFGDGRLNPDRGQGTARGAAQMQQFWTDTVPRQLVPGAELRPSPIEQRLLGGH